MIDTRKKWSIQINMSMIYFRQIVDAGGIRWLAEMIHVNRLSLKYLRRNYKYFAIEY